AVYKTEIPEQTAVPMAEETATEGTTSGVIVTVALPDISAAHPVVVFAACTVYVPAAVCRPKLSAAPVPATGPATSTAPKYRLYATPSSEKPVPTDVPPVPKQ